VTRESLDRAIDEDARRQPVGDVGHAVKAGVEQNGFSVCVSFVGHGIGTRMHDEPNLPITVTGRGARLQEGMVIAVSRCQRRRRKFACATSGYGNGGWQPSAHFDIPWRYCERAVFSRGLKKDRATTTLVAVIFRPASESRPFAVTPRYARSAPRGCHPPFRYPLVAHCELPAPGVDHRTQTAMTIPSCSRAPRPSSP